MKAPLLKLVLSICALLQLLDSQKEVQSLMQQCTALETAQAGAKQQQKARSLSPPRPVSPVSEPAEVHSLRQQVGSTLHLFSLCNNDWRCMHVHA